MTVMLLALFLSDAPANASNLTEYKLVGDQDGGGSTERRVIADPVHHRAWEPRVNWISEKDDCPVFFQRDLSGFGTVRVGPRCTPEHDPVAL